MNPREAVFVDSSVLMRLIGLDGDDLAREIAAEFDERSGRGQRFVIPVTAIIETGNHIAQLSSDRRRFAMKFADVLRAVRSAQIPWTVRASSWDEEFVQELLNGNATGSSLIDLVGDGRMGTGDIAILVERDRFRRETAYIDVGIWTLDRELAAFS